MQSFKQSRSILIKIRRSYFRLFSSPLFQCGDQPENPTSTIFYVYLSINRSIDSSRFIDMCKNIYIDPTSVLCNAFHFSLTLFGIIIYINHNIYIYIFLWFTCKFNNMTWESFHGSKHRFTSFRWLCNSLWYYWTII